MTNLDIYHLFIKKPATSDLVPEHSLLRENRLIYIPTKNLFHPKYQHIMKVLQSSGIPEAETFG